MKDEEVDEEIGFKDIEISGVFIKHDFDHMIVDEDEAEVSRYTAGDLACVKMKQSLQVPFEHDIQILVYFMFAHYPHVETVHGQDEVEATMNEMHNGGDKAEQCSSGVKKFDLKLIIGRNPPPEGIVHPPECYGVEIYYFFKSQKLLLEWISSPRNDSLADSICLLIM